jgi:hypothetical protein
MKKILLSLLALVASVGIASATTSFFDFGDPHSLNSAISNPASGGSTNFTQGTVLTSGIATVTNTKNSSTPAKFYQNGANLRIYSGCKITVATTNGEKISSITLAKGSTLAITADSGTLTDSIWTGDATSVVFTASATNKIAHMTVVSYAAAGTQPPVFSAVGGNYINPFKLAISSATTGASIYYTTDGTAPSATSTLYADSITISKNTTVKAVAILNSVASDVVTEVYTFPTEVANIAAFLATDDNTQCKFANPVTVAFQYSNTTKSQLYVQDNTGAALIYGETGQTYKNGDEIPAGIVGTKTTYNKLPEFGSPIASTFKAGVAGTAVAPKAVAISAIDSTMLNQYVIIKSAKVDSVDAKNAKISVGTDSVAGYAAYGVAIPKSGNYDVTGFVSTYKGTLQIQATDYAAISTGICRVNDNADVKVFAANGNIYIAGAAGKAQIFDVAGRLVTTVANGEVSMPAGYYIVRVANSAKAVIVR